MADQHMPEHFGQQPKASPAARTWAVILGLLLLAAGVIGVRETWLVGSGSDAQSWVQPVLNLIATEELQTWMIWAGVASIVVGLIFLFAAARRVPGVTSAQTSADSKTAKVTVNGDTEDAELQGRVETAVTRCLAHLKNPPQVTVAVEKIPELDNNV